jgi:hypothetical protein
VNARRSDDPGRRLGWPEFEHRLAGVLGVMPVESYLILSASDEAGGYYVQFAYGREAGLRAEAVSNAFLAAPRALTAEQEERLGSLGWHRPGEDGDAGRNFYRMWPDPAPAEEVARLAVAALRDVYGVASPAALVYRHRTFDDGRILDASALGIPAEPRTELAMPLATPAHPADVLRGRVEGALRSRLGVGELIRDVDGDYPIRIGSALMFVRLVEGVPPVVQLFSIVVADVDESPELLAALNDVNRRIRFGRAFWADRRVVVTMELTAIDLTADQVAFGINQLGNLADGLDDWLSGRFGGSTAFESRRQLLN